MRRYVEAFPILNAAHCRRAAVRGASLVHWVGGAGRLVGAAEAAWRSPDRLAIRYCVESEAGLTDQGDIELEIAYEGSGDNNKRPVIVCPRCGDQRSSVVLYDRSWYCRLCHGLRYASAVVGTPVRRAEKYRKLEAELRQMVRSSRRADVVERKRQEVAEALTLAGPKPHPVANSNYAFRVSAKWVVGEPSSR